MALYLQLRNPGCCDEQISEALDAGFLEPSHRALWAHYQHERAHRDDPFHQRYYANFIECLRTRSLESVVDLTEWRRSRHHNEYGRACGPRRSDCLVTSARKRGIAGAPGAGSASIGSRRAVSAADRTPRASVSSRAATAHRAPIVETAIGPEVASLPFQLQRVLACLLQGDAEKQIAARLGISRHTVNRHLHRLYCRFGVHSRGELMYRCRDMLHSSPRIRRCAREVATEVDARAALYFKAAVKWPRG